MPKSDKKLAKTVEKLKSNLDEYENIEHPIFREHLTKLGTEILKTEMIKRAEKIGK